jgi:polar amino acid transport system substrate-binding protein
LRKKNIKYVFGLCLFLFFTAIPEPLPGAEVITQRSIKVGGDNHLPPYEYVNDNGIYKGFNVDIMHAIAIQSGLDIELHPMPLYMLPASIEKGDIDAIQGMTQTDERKKMYDFSEPYLTISRCIFVRHDNNFIADIEDLQHVRVAVQKGNVPPALLRYKTPESLYYVDNQQQGILLLMMGNVDAFVGNKMVGLYTIQKWKQTNFIKLVGGEIEPAKYSLAVKKGNTEFLEVFNRGLKQIKANGTYDKIYKKWFGEIIQTPGEIWGNVMRRLFFVLGGAGLLVLVVLRWNQLLKQEVRKRTQELADANRMLQEQNERINKEHGFKIQILESVFQGVMTVRRDGMVSFCNTHSWRQLKTEKDMEVVGANIRDLPLDRFIDMEKLRLVLENGETFFNQEKTMRTNGEDKVISYSLFPLRAGSDAINGAIISFRDVTGERRLQETLRQKDKMQALGQLVAAIAHEIRNPLMAVKTFVKLLPSRLEDRSFQKEMLEYVPQELDRLNRLATDLLDYARPRKANKEMIPVKLFLLEVLSLFHNECLEKGIEIKVEAGENVLAYADRQQFKQIIINLMLNAIQAVESRGKISLKASEAEMKTVIEVSDSGKGIPAQLLDKVMDPFFSLKKDGTGLGLSICYQLVKEHGGEISIDSQENEGTRVTVILPREKKDDADE